MTLKPIFELGVSEVYEILTESLGVADLPPLEAIENEDWGRDLILTRLGQFPPEQLATLGLTTKDVATEDQG